MMGMSESSRLYLKNYYILEQARNETQVFLTIIAQKLSENFEEHMKLLDPNPFKVTNWSMKAGGMVQIQITERSENMHLANLGNVNYSIYYQDAMRDSNLDSSLLCRVSGYSTANCKRFEAEVRRVASVLALPDPYRSILTNILNQEQDETISILTRQFVERYDDIHRILETMVSVQ